jgi:hypothetical protein
MNKEKQRIAIAKACGVLPKRMWRVWYDSEKQHGSICIKTKQEAVDRASQEKDAAIRLGYAVSISEPEEYDEWEDVPNYIGDLNSMAEAEMILFDRIDWSVCNYDRYLGVATSSWKWNATAAQRAEAFLKTLGLWETNND